MALTEHDTLHITLASEQPENAGPKVALIAMSQYADTSKARPEYAGSGQ